MYGERLTSPVDTSEGDVTEWERRFPEIEELAEKLGCSYDEAARILGIKNPDYDEDMRVIREYLNKEPSTNPGPGPEKSGVFCGDCGRCILPGESCSHMSVGKRGGRRIGKGPGFLR